MAQFSLPIFCLVYPVYPLKGSLKGTSNVWISEAYGANNLKWIKTYFIVSHNKIRHEYYKRHRNGITQKWHDHRNNCGLLLNMINNWIFLGHNNKFNWHKYTKTYWNTFQETRNTIWKPTVQIPCYVKI